MKKTLLLISLFLASQQLNATEIQNSNQNFMLSDESFAQEFDTSSEINNYNDDFDPLEGYNRFMTKFNDKTYEYVLTPVANGYKAVTPEFFRDGVSNVFDNLMFPMRFINNLLQLKFENSAIELSRFVINSTIGVAGIFDVANDHFNLKQKDEDLGQTLGYYGVGEGFHIVLPILGPSNLRDLVGLSVDNLANPLNIHYDDKLDYKIPNSSKEELIYTGAYTVSELPVRMERYEAVKAGTIDIYPVLKEFYNKNREKEINE